MKAMYITAVVTGMVIGLITDALRIKGGVTV